MIYKKTSLIFSFSLLVCLIANSQSDTISIGIKRMLYSKVLNENRKLWIYTPASYKDSSYGIKSYPVLYLLDGEAHFHSTTGILLQLSEGINGNFVVPEMIVVAIENTNRNRDLTPTNSLIGAEGKVDSFFMDTGGGENFIRFIQNELIPYIDSAYRTLNHKIIIGHSFGGLAVLHMLLNHPQLFNNYIAIDPSVWWDNLYLIRSLQAKKDQTLKNHQLYIAIANTLPDKLSYKKMPKDKSQESAHIRSIHKFVEILQKQKMPGLTFTYTYMPDDDHGSSTLLATHNGIRQFYKNYAIKNVWEKDTAFIRNHYEQVSQRLGYRVLPSGRMLAINTWFDLQDKKLDRALAAALLNKTFYPDSPIIHRMLGDVYAARKEKEKAIESYKHSLQLKPEQKNVKEKLEELQKEMVVAN
jgi:uncharacterized protein